ncbi:MAG: hypothetical protein OZ921_17435 [Sorangiineae bacterium]|nr:hypothetical protein [Polyangiaceae bacterium]MEB2324301.1 hypothetical protein [Sorangiineae bacterium]
MRLVESPARPSRPRAARALALVAAWSLGLAACGPSDDAASRPRDPCRLPVEDLPEPPLHTPRWAFEPWISKDISDTDDTYAFVEGFESRGIPVGVVVLDSPWETNYNTFVPNPERYHDFGKLVSDLHAKSVRVVLWITQMVNYSSLDYEEGGDTYPSPSPNWSEAEQCGFLVDDAYTYSWWKGRGAGLDFTNPRALAWWHEQQAPLFRAGVDGFKCDFGDSYVLSDPVETSRGPIPHQEYSELYYKDFYTYGVHARGREDFVTMVRPWDASYGFAGRFYARKEHAPVGWVGDNLRNFAGLEDALDHIFVSARAGYAVLGSDIGGYLDRDDQNLAQKIPFDQDVFARWTAVGALSPFMELHGRANQAPWTVPERADETVTLYRYWATLHSELVPFFYSLAEETAGGGPPIIAPVGEPASWPGDYRYLLGEALLVAPVLDSTGARDVALPDAEGWYDWWKPADDVLPGGQTLTAYDTSDRTRIPLFVRKGAIIPARVSSSLTGLGTERSAGALTLAVYPASARHRFTLHDEDDRTTEITSEGARVTLSRAPLPVVLRVRVDLPPSAVFVNNESFTKLSSLADLEAAEQGWLLEPALRSAWVKLSASATPLTVELR